MFTPRIILLIGIFLWINDTAIEADTLADWDKNLSNYNLGPISIEAPNAVDAWHSLNQNYGVRCVLVISEDNNLQLSQPFTLDSDNSSFRSILGSFADFYELELVQDQTTGIHWLIPKTSSYSELMSESIVIANDAYGVPFFSQVLLPLSHSVPFSISSALDRWGEFSVDIPHGEYTVRDLINLGLSHYPACSLLCGVYSPDSPEVGAYWLDLIHLPTIDNSQAFLSSLNSTLSLSFPVTQAARTDAVKSLVASPDYNTHKLGKLAIQVMGWSFPLDEFPSQDMELESALWAALGVSEVMLKDPNPLMSGFSDPCIQTFAERTSDEFFRSGDAKLAVLTALELCRIQERPHRNPQYDQIGENALLIVSQRNFATGELSDIVPDIWRITRRSPLAMRLFAEQGSSWLSSMDESLDGLDELAEGPQMLSFSLQK